MASSKQLALALILPLTMSAEGLRHYAYKDPVGLPTICFGSTTNVHLGDVRTDAECRALLTKEMTDVINEVDRCRPGLPPKVLAAFSDAAYNIGSHIACDSKKSTAARLLEQRDYKGACNQLLRWDKARVGGVQVVLPGLTKRREMERDLCLSS